MTKDIFTHWISWFINKGSLQYLAKANMTVILSGNGSRGLTLWFQWLMVKLDGDIPPSLNGHCPQFWVLQLWKADRGMLKLLCWEPIKKWIFPSHMGSQTLILHDVLFGNFHKPVMDWNTFSSTNFWEKMFFWTSWELPELPYELLNFI